MKIQKFLYLALCAMLSSCVTTKMDYRIDSIHLEKVAFEGNVSSFADISATRDFYVLQVGVTPVHYKRSGAMSVRPYQDGCVDQIADIVVESAEHSNINQTFGNLSILDGSCEGIMMGHKEMPTLEIYYYNSINDIKEGLQSGSDVSFRYLISSPKGSPEPNSVTLKTSDRSITGTVSTTETRYEVQNVFYHDANGGTKILP